MAEAAGSLGVAGSDLLGLGLLEAGDVVLSALAHDTATPVLADLLEAVIVVGLD